MQEADAQYSNTLAAILVAQAVTFVGAGIYIAGNDSNLGNVIDNIELISMSIGIGAGAAAAHLGYQIDKDSGIDRIKEDLYSDTIFYGLFGFAAVYSTAKVALAAGVAIQRSCEFLGYSGLDSIF
ncbi:hypothetical protein HOA92_00495 [archaeon]|jgi:hypothetical protein|nr:hypothetical protein [archaeon]MBT6761497.1 hypothetical protein [archaeon]